MYEPPFGACFMDASPIDITEVPAAQELAKAVAEDIDRQFMATITQTVGFAVDKDELIKALNYDRDQYNKGYRDGYLSGEHSVHCRDCKHYNTDPEGWCDMHSHYHDDEWGPCFDPDDYCSYGEFGEKDVDLWEGEDDPN